MKLVERIENIINEKIIELKETSYGITNKNYIVKTQNKTYFCRVPKDMTTINNKKNELEAINLLKNEDYFLEIVYYDKNLLITEFKPNSKTFISNKNLSSILEIAKILKKLHNKNIKTESIFNPIETLEQYRYKIYQYPKDKNLTQFDFLIKKFEKHYKPDRLCHNDLVEGNFLFADNKIYLIDFEYSGLNDYYFDIASFISENDLNYQEIVTFLKAYFDKENCDFEKLDVFLKFSDLLWFNWAWMLYEIRQEEIYKFIAEEKYNKLVKPRKIVY
ncbi:phosphotransferase [Gemelliphila palaticanis]|uniref:Phosphotransferase n=1 Tax=Gemelliphila palaticanis TaxID=81950 RepID=A0ABX2SYX9_9BACL|nr:phosphotransferase [Gemella palaticanis]MBF0715641.1 phosphotransferase [Gemella palaticanis]NYS47571.1 phosphotransferase [Gemella palaticanis]